MAQLFSAETPPQNPSRRDLPRVERWRRGMNPRKGFGKELELNRCANERAAGVATDECGLARIEKRREGLIAVEDLHLEFTPKARGPRKKLKRRARGLGSGIAHDTGVAARKLNHYSDAHGFHKFVMIDLSLLGTVAVGFLAGKLSKKGIRSEKGYRGNVGSGLGRGEMFCVRVQETSEGFIVALAHEIGLPDGGVRQRGNEGRTGQNQAQRNCKKARKRAEEGEWHG